METVRGLIERDTIISSNKLDLDGISSLVGNYDLLVSITVKDLDSENTSDGGLVVRVEDIIVLSDHWIGIDIGVGDNLKIGDDTSVSQWTGHEELLLEAGLGDVTDSWLSSIRIGICRWLETGVVASGGVSCKPTTSLCSEELGDHGEAIIILDPGWCRAGVVTRLLG